MNQQSLIQKDLKIALAQLELAKQSSLLVIRDCPDEIKVKLELYFNLLIDKLRASSSVG